MTTLHSKDCQSGDDVAADKYHEMQRYQRETCDLCQHDLLNVRVFTGCFNCDHEQEFQGRIGDYDTAYFPCPNCGETFQMSDFSTTFNEDEDEGGE